VDHRVELDCDRCLTYARTQDLPLADTENGFGHELIRRAGATMDAVESHIVQRWAANLAMTSALDVRIAEQGTL
jgi:hypothetical protein